MLRNVTTPGRASLAAVLAVTLVVFASVVAYVGVSLRSGLRDQVLKREAQTLTELACFQLASEAQALSGLGVDDAPGGLLTAVLKTSKVRGVFAVRVFDASQRAVDAVPIPWTDAPPAAPDWRELMSGHPIARLHARESAADVIGLAPTAADERNPEPLLEAWLPLRTTDAGPLVGAAQLWTDGRDVADEFAAIDRRLVTHSLLSWLAGAAIISVVLSGAYRRLAQANDALRARSDDLARANRELVLAAKTSALGTVTAHLMHAIKNPVAGLEEFVASRSEAPGTAEQEGELAAASELTRRLRSMINDVASVMRDEQSGAQFELTCGEILELALEKAGPIARARGVELRSSVGAFDALPAKRANLTRLILHNLLQNAIEASPAGAPVEVRAEAAGGSLVFVVEDRGPGLPPGMAGQLFQPCTSTKPGGSGLGLALSRQLARQAGGEIELVRSSTTGTCFRLVLQHPAP